MKRIINEVVEKNKKLRLLLNKVMDRLRRANNLILLNFSETDLDNATERQKTDIEQVHSNDL